MDEMASPIEQGSSVSDHGATFWITDGFRIALAETSVIPKDLSVGYIDDADCSEIRKKEIIELIHSSDNVFFFSRLNVPVQIEKKGHGIELLKRLLAHMDEHNGFLLNTASAYGKKSQEDLIKYYQKNGMELLSKEGLLVYHKNLRGGSLKPKATQPK